MKRLRIKRKVVKGQHWIPIEFYGGKTSCPEASTLGYGDYEVRPGQWVSYRERREDWEGNVYWAECWGRVVCNADFNDRKHLCVATLAMDGFSIFLRFVDPNDIMSIRAQKDYCSPTPRKVFDWITGEDFLTWIQDPELIVKASDYGTLSEEYIGQLPEHRRAWEVGCSPSAYPYLLKEAEEQGKTIEEYLEEQKRG